MAIPNSPNWSSLTDIKPYPQPAFVKPPAPAGLAAVSLGPIELNDSKGVLNSRYWLVTQSGNQVQIQGAEGLEWGVTENLFSESQPIQQISLTFDQLGRPLVFYRVGEDTLKLYWYDPVAQQNVTTTLTTGKDPTACFDFPQDTGQSFTDVLLFYVRDDQVFMRIQRDRYAIEYPCPAIQPGLKINSAGLRVDNRLQVVYQFKDTGYNSNIKPIVPVNIKGVYYNSGQSCFISNKIINIYSDDFTIGFNVLKSDRHNQYFFGSNNRTQLYSYIFKVGATWFLNIYKAGQERTIIIPIESLLGSWEIDFKGNSSQIIIKKNDVIIFNGNITKGVENTNLNNVNIVFSGSDYNDGKNLVITETGNSYGFVGVINDCWINHNNEIIYWNVDQSNQKIQKDATDTQTLLIKNHKSAYWQYEKV